MNFFEAQDHARRGTRKLVVMFLLAVVGIVVALNAVALAAAWFLERQQSQEVQVESGGAPSMQDVQNLVWRPELYGIVTLVALAVIGGASAFKSMQIAGDGGKVARLMGGRPIDPHSPDDDERKLLNIVEEMSIASGVPVPDVYVLDDEQGINAFAAGSTIDEAAIGVTRGCIQKLSRDELQGVIAHEFSHILNGDMRLNMRLIGIVFGILVIGLLGYTLFRYTPYMISGGGSRSRDNKGGAGAIVLVLILVGLAVWLIGSIGVFFGRMIQASVSRQREFLADASAVQFTRNPPGIRDALRKIGGNASRAKVMSRHAGEIGHMWFGEAMGSVFATHPPLPDRIKAIDPQWDGTMLKAEFGEGGDEAMRRADARRATEQQRRQKARPVVDPLTLLGAAAAGAGAARGAGSQQRTAAPRLRADHVAHRVGDLDQEHIRFAGQLLGALPQEIRDAAHDPELARGLVTAMLLSSDQGVRLMQDEAIAQKDPGAAAAADQFGRLLLGLGPAARLPVLELCLPAVRRSDDSTRSHFLSVLADLIKADERVEPFEYALYKIIEQSMSRRAPERVKWSSTEAVAGHAQVMLSALAAAGSVDGAAAERAYKHGIGRLRQGQLKYAPQFTLEQLDESLRELSRSAPAVKQQLIDAAGATVAADGVVQVQEAELLRAFAAAIGCPLPPFIEQAKAAPAPAA